MFKINTQKMSGGNITRIRGLLQIPQPYTVFSNTQSSNTYIM